MVTLGDRPCCSTCGAYLRRTRADATQCDPCRRAAPALSLDPGLWDEPALSTALACLDFGPVFLRVRAETSWSQRRLGELFDMDQSTLSKIELGKRPLTDAATVIRVTNALGIPAGKLGFRYGVTVGPIGQEGVGMDRRDAIEHVAALSVGAGLPLDRLIALFPSAEPSGTRRRIGVADVEAIEQATAAYVRQDRAEGGGMIRDAAVAQLYATLPLRSAQVSAELRPRLMIATGRLAMQAGWMSFDVKHHDAARRLWLIGLGFARDSEHPLGSDLTVYLLANMAQQAVHLGHPDEALRLVHFGYGAAAGTDVSPATISFLAGTQARAHAARSDAAGCDRALGQAIDYFAAIDPTRRAPWGNFDETIFSAYQGAAHYGMALARRDPRAASRAVPLLRAAETGFGPGYARTRALYLPDLAGAHALAGDIDTALALGHQAIDAVTSVHSPRVYDRLQVLQTVLEPMHTSPGVAELRERLSTTAT